MRSSPSMFGQASVPAVCAVVVACVSMVVRARTYLCYMLIFVSREFACPSRWYAIKDIGHGN